MSAAALLASAVVAALVLRYSCREPLPLLSYYSQSPSMQVSNPRVGSQADDRDGTMAWDGYETVYGRVANAAANEKDGIVQHLTGGEQLALQFVAVPDHRCRIRAEVSGSCS